MSTPNGTATLAKATPRADLSEIGRSGLRAYYGQIQEEQLRDLQGQKAAATYGAMRSDPIVGAMLFCIEQLARQTDWTVEPFHEADNEDLERSEFVNSCFDDMSASWGDTLSEILTMLPYGFAFHEIVWKVRKGDVEDPSKRSKYTDGRIGIRKLPGRAPETVSRWVFDDEGGIQGMVQTPPPQYLPREIPIDKAILFRTTAERGNPEGRSVLRTAYLPWRRKTRIEELEGIGIERDLSGYPVLELQPEAPDLWLPENSALLGKLERIIRNIRRDEQEGFIQPPWVKLALLSTGSRRQYDTTQIITRYDQRIAMTVMADFLLIGHDSVGSRALVEPKQNMFGLALSSFLDRIAETINRHLIPRLFRLNGFPTDRLCTFAHGDVVAPDLEKLGVYISQLAGSGMPLFPSTSGELERALLAAGKLPLSGDEEVAKRDRGERDTSAALARRLVGVAKFNENHDSDNGQFSSGEGGGSGGGGASSGGSGGGGGGESPRVVDQAHIPASLKTGQPLQVHVFRGAATGSDEGTHGWFTTDRAQATRYSVAAASRTQSTATVSAHSITLSNPYVVASHAEMLNMSASRVAELRTAGHDGAVQRLSGGMKLKDNPNPTPHVWVYPFAGLAAMRGK